MAVSRRIRSMASDFRLYSHQLQFLFNQSGITGEVLAAIGEDGWGVKRVLSVDSARAVIAVGPRGDSRIAALVKISRNNFAARVMERERRALAELRADARLSGLLPILPAQIAWGHIGAQAFSVESALPGIDSRLLLDDPLRSARAQAATLEVAKDLHRSTARVVTVDSTLTARWIDEPLHRMAQLGGPQSRIRRRAGTLERIGASLTSAMLGRRLAVSWVHGDLFVGNVLVSEGGAAVTGLVDWDLAAPDDLPVLDVVHLLLSTHLLRAGVSLGETVTAILDGEGFDFAAVEAAQENLGGEPLTMRESVLLEWLRHVSSNLVKSTHFGRHQQWVRANVETVLDYLDERGVA